MIAGKTGRMLTPGGDCEESGLRPFTQYPERFKI